MSDIKPTGFCVECNATTTHADAYFCGACAGGFYNEEETE